MAFAVIKTGGKQYRVAVNDVLKVEKLEAAAGDTVTFDQVLMIGDDAGTMIGTPLVEGALVAAELAETRKQKTVIVFKKNRRHNYRRRNGHRQLLSTVRITEIVTSGGKPATKAAKAEKAETVAEEARPARAPAARKASPKAETAEDAPAGKAAPKKTAADGEAAAEKPAAARKAPAKKAAPTADKE